MSERCEERGCVAARVEVVKRDYSAVVATWFVRAAHERYCLNHAAAILAETCPTCHGVTAESRPGTQIAPAIRGAGGRFAKGDRSRRRWFPCKCPVNASLVGNLAEFHGLTEIWPENSQERSTGVPVV